MSPSEGDDEYLTDRSEVLYRHVHPNWIKSDEPTSQAFRPNSKDEGKLSTARGSMTSAAGAFALYTEGLGLRAAGTWAVSVGELAAEPSPLNAVADPIEDDPCPDPAHAYIDFGVMHRKTIEAKAKVLLAAARRRGRQHP